MKSHPSQKEQFIIVKRNTEKCTIILLTWGNENLLKDEEDMWFSVSEIWSCWIYRTNCLLRDCKQQAKYRKQL